MIGSFSSASRCSAEDKEHWSIVILREAFVKDKIMSETELPFMIYDVQKNKDYADVEVRINNAKAGRGDPNVAPLLGMFRIWENKKILWYSVEDDEYKPWPIYVKQHASR
jgi:hypothetical protein